MVTVGQRPQYTATLGPTIAEMERGLRRWAAANPQLMTVEIAGHSPRGLPVLLCRISDQSVVDDDKQVALFTATHTGLERIAASAVLKLIKWLLSDDPLADEIRRKQIVLAMPVCEPESYDAKSTDTTTYFSGRTGKVYDGWTWDGPEDPSIQPEAMAIKSVMDSYQPEVHQDVHGTWFQEQTMWESTGVSWASNLYRTYAPQVARLMNEAAEEAGFIIGGAEEASGQILSTVPVEGAAHWFYGRKSTPKIVAGLYAYRQYHTLSQTSEVGWVESALIRYRRLLELGNEVWRGEPRAGYPVNQINWWGSSAIAAWGTTAAERRRSRVELWQKLPQINSAMGHPEPRNDISAFVSTDPQALVRYAGGSGVETNFRLEALFAKLVETGRFNREALGDFLRRSPARNATFRSLDYDGKVEPIASGIAIRLMLPFPSVNFSHLKLDGHDMQVSDRDGYVVYHNPATIIQVNIPPGKVQDFHVVTCIYDPPTDRPSGFQPADWTL